MIVGFENKDWSTVGMLNQPDDKKSDSVIIMIHSLFSNKTGINRFFHYLSLELTRIGFYTYRFDLPTDGESYMFNDNISPLKMILDLIIFIKEKYHFNKVYLIGQCLGGIKSLELADHYNELIDGIVVFDMYEYVFTNPVGMQKMYRPLIVYIINYLLKLFDKKTWIKLFKWQIRWKVIIEYTIKSILQSFMFLTKSLKKKNKSKSSKISSTKKIGKKVLVINSLLIPNYEIIMEMTNKLIINKGFSPHNYIVNDKLYTISWFNAVKTLIISWFNEKHYI